MKFGQIVDLSLAGYTREQITAIDAVKDPKAVELALSVKNFDEFNALAGMADSAEETPPEDLQDNKPAESVPADPEKPKQEDDKEKEINNLKAKLAEAQKVNASKDLSGGKGVFEMAQDTLSNILNEL